MIRRHQSLLSRVYILHDLAWTALSLLLAWWIRFNTNILPLYAHLSFSNYMSILAVALPGFAAGAGVTGLYSATRNSSLRNLSLQIAKSVVLMALLVMSLLYFDKQVHYSRAVLAMFLLFTWVAVLVGRLAIRQVLKGVRAQGLNRKFILLVGVTAATGRFLEQILSHTEYGYHAIGYLDLMNTASGSRIDAAAWQQAIHHIAAASEPQERSTLVREQLETLRVPCLGGLDQLDQVLSQQIVDHVVLTLPHEASALLSPLVMVAESHGVHALLVPDFIDILPSKPRFADFAGLPIVDTRYAPLDDAVNSFAKRAFDIVFSVLVLVLLSPLYAAIAVAVRLSSPGPVIYRQERLGKNRRAFCMYKFRTMRHPDAGAQSSEDEEESAWTVPHDPRRTLVGRWLRSTSLDELPQFWNVLRGDMSVIGPRPERPHFVEQFRTDVPKYMIKHRVRPGITGWAQVNGLRGNTSIEDRIEYDLKYIEQWSFTWDLRIVLLTVLKGMRHRNAY